MSEWIDSTVGSVTLYQRAGGTPTATTDSFYGGDIPFVTIEDITNGTRFLDRTVKNLTEAGLANSAAWLIKEPHILYSMYATVGKPIINRIDCATNQAIIALKESSEIEQSFLFYQLLFIRPSVFKYTAQTTQSNLNAGSVKKLPISYPKDKREQRKIAAILTGIDTAIEKTEALIAKYQQIKAGLMHDLFTRGVLPNGQLRPPREQSPELYQESVIGWIPKEWRFTTCSKVCEKIIDCKNRTPPETPDGFPVIRKPNVRDGEFVDAELLYTDERSYVIWTMRGKPQVGDIVITREAPVGEVCMIPERHPAACLGQRMMLYRPNQQLIDPRYFLYALQSRPIQNRLDLISGGSTVGHVRVGDIRDLWMFMPESPEEQRLIASALDGISEKLRSELAQREKLQQKKSGLMHDLLTGKVPVKVEETEVVDG